MGDPEKEIPKETNLEKDKLDNYNNNADDKTPLKIKKIIETEEEHKKRKWSRWVIYFSMFIQSIGFSIVLTGVWPYIELLEDNPDKRLLGWAVAANPIGQLIFSPLMGYWCNKVNVRVPSVACLIIFIIANIWYALLPLHTTGGTWFLMVARFLVGVSSGSIAVCRTYLTKETTVGERTAAISHLSLFQAVGFILGPAVQSALVPLGKEGIKIGSYSISMYTGAGWISFILGVLNLIMFHPKIFVETNMAQKEADYILKKNQEDAKKLNEKVVDWSKIPPDYFGIGVVIIAFFWILFNFILLETLGVPVAMDQFEWSESEAIFWVGITISISSVLTVACFATIAPICKRVDERIVLLGLGLIPMVFGRIFLFPFGGDPPALQKFGCLTTENNTKIYDREECDSLGLHWEVVDPGCSIQQTWCSQIPALNGYAVMVGYAVCTIGYPYAIALIQTIFSKMVGPRPQGVWVGVLTSVASLSRACGPIFVSYIYTNFGTIATNGVATGFMAFSLFILALNYKRLVPIKLPKVDDKDKAEKC